MSLERTYSKAKAVGGHVVWTNQEVIPVTFALDGLLTDQAEFAAYRVVGRPAYCVGYHAEYRVPPKDRRVQVAVNMCTGLGVLVPNGTLSLAGITTGGDKLFTPPVAMPSSSTWKFIIQVATPDDQYTPEGLTITYFLRYANGPVTNTIATAQVSQGSFNFWTLGSPFMTNG